MLVLMMSFDSVKQEYSTSDTVYSYSLENNHVTRSIEHKQNKKEND